MRWWKEKISIRAFEERAYDMSACSSIEESEPSSPSNDYIDKRAPKAILLDIDIWRMRHLHSTSSYCGGSVTRVSTTRLSSRPIKRTLLRSLAERVESWPTPPGRDGLLRHD
jgi:hypothetical protein